MPGPAGNGPVGEDDVRRVAQLARLRLAEEEVRTFTLQLNDILAHVEELRAAGEEVRAAGGEVRAAGEGGGDPVGARRPDGRARPPAGAAPLGNRGEDAPAPGQDVPGPDPLLHTPAELAPAFQEGFFTLPRLAAMDSGEAAAPGGGS